MRMNQINSGREMLMSLGEMGLLGEVTGEEYDQIMRGEIPMTVLQKMTTLQERDMVSNLAATYPTAGIQLEDSFEIASQKIGNLQNKNMVIDLAGRYPEAGINTQDSYEIALMKLRLLSQSKNEYDRQVLEYELQSDYNLRLWEYNVGYQTDAANLSNQAAIDAQNQANQAATNAQNQTTAERNQLRSLMTQYPGAGIKETDTHEQAIAKINTFTKTSGTQAAINELKNKFKRHFLMHALQEWIMML
jgi:hypothetical protein